MRGIDSGRQHLRSLSIAITLLIGTHLTALADRWEDRATGPERRTGNTAVWTGTEMIIFGGLTIHEQWVSKNTGARYNPATDTWTALPTDGAPNTAEQIAVWTGTDMLVWG